MDIDRMLRKRKQVASARTNTGGLSRRKLIAGGGALAGVAALAGANQAEAHDLEFLTLDIACDGRTLRLVRMDPTATDQLPTRGDTFIVNGKIYPGGTIEEGLSGPDQAGSIGTWICRGWIYNPMADPELVPHAATVQIYLFDDGSELVSDGLEGGIPTRRSVVGGKSHWAHARGDVSQEAVEENDTMLDLGPSEMPAPNFRFVFSLTTGGT